MRKQVYELRKNGRARHLLVERAGAAPRNRMHRRAKNFSLSVTCAADYPHRVVMAEKMQLELLQRGLYSDMKPLDIFKGDFEVVEGFEEEFREISREFGFNASEVMEVD